jgi:hypothetical protein
MNAAEGPLIDTSQLPLDEEAKRRVHRALKESLERELKNAGQDPAAIFGETSVHPVMD